MDPNIADLFQREGVTFVGKGKKIIDGKQTDEDAIIIGVVEKKPLDKLSKRQIIPKEVGGQKTDIVQTGYIVRRNYEEEIRITRQRPIFPGISVGHPDVSAGTFGAVVYAEEIITEDPTQGLGFWDKLLMALLKWLGWITPEQINALSFQIAKIKAYMLSNNHILANENRAKIGDPIWQPGKYDGGGKNDVVAILSEYVPISYTRPNKVDVAIAEITVDYNPAIYQIGVPKEPRYDLHVGEYLQHSGRTLGLKKAKIIAMGAYTEVWYDRGVTEWEDQIIVGLCDDGSPSSEGGTSGSLWLDMDKRPAGVLYAGSDEVTCINPIKAVQEALKTKIYF